MILYATSNVVFVRRALFKEDYYPVGKCLSHEHNLLIFHDEQKIFFHHRHKKLITEEKTLDFYVIQSLVYILYILILYVGYLHIPRLIINKYLKKYSLISYFRFKIASVIKYIARIKTKTWKDIILVAVLFCCPF